ncbi:MAG: hypothetical protein M0017_04705 [Desulfobacteraceae bacterium]|nr:hypothetical protein [Desulfobacteraceae bacterium]
MPVVLGALVFMCSFPGITVTAGPLNEKLRTLEDVPREYWSVLAKKRIIFAHQSVGDNILDGVKDVMKDHDFIHLNIVETPDLVVPRQPVLAHWRAGVNGKPFSKLAAFANALEQKSIADVDIALVKLCFVDITQDSDVDSIFQAYADTMEQLKKKHPHIEFIHVTVPLCSVRTGLKWDLKQRIRRVLGRSTVIDDNDRRQRYNQLLRGKFTDAGSFFDLALVESTNGHGRKCFAERSGETVPILCPEHSADGGHLNALGRRQAAEQLLITLAQAAYRQDHQLPISAPLPPR